MNAPLRHGDAFAGIGGFGLAARDAGWTTVWAAEIEPSARLVYSTRLGHDELRFDTDIRYSRDLPELDVLTGGFPCQDLSVAGKREGLAGERSGLFHHLARLLHGSRPEWFVFENVPGLLSSHSGKDMQTVLHGCSGFCPTIPERGWGTAGGVVGPAYAVVWRVLNSQYFGVAQRRRRVFFVGHSSGDIRRAWEVLFERQGVRGDSPEISKAGRDVAYALAARTHKGGDPTTDQYVVAPLTQRAYGDGATDDPPLVAGALQTMGPGGGWRIGADETARNQIVTDALRSGSGCIGGNQSASLVASPVTASAGHHGHIAPTLRCGGMADANRPAGAGPDNVPLVAFQCNGSNVGPAGTLRAGNGNEPGGVPFMAVSENQRGELRLSELAPALGHGGGKPGQGYPAVAQTINANVGRTYDSAGSNGTGPLNLIAFQSSQSGVRVSDTHPTLDSWRLGWAEGDGRECGPETNAARVRTPSGIPGPLDLCETCIEGPDSPRYRGLGNAVTYNTVRWMLGRIEQQRRRSQ